MTRGRTTTMTRTAHGLMREMCVAVILIGLAFQASAPGLIMVAKTQAVVAFGPLGQSLCHVPDGGDESFPGGGKDSSSGDGCCLICQAMQLAGGAISAPILHTPTASVVAPRVPVASKNVAHRWPWLHQPSRAPPIS